ncbi:MAG: class I SAM-dependent methyltransferase [Dehalococcoidia bacterium]|nr:class I SAM-dependent methyltransferase [Dehalococcoidia bacterium]
MGGAEATQWLLERARLAPGAAMLDAGAFVGAAARAAAARGARAVALDVVPDFLAAGRALEGGRAVDWVTADARRLPFADGTFASVWCLESSIFPRELSRVARATGATLCLGCEAPADGRGGLEAFLEEWAEYGWRLASHRPLSLEALATWRRCEAELVARRPHFEARYGTRGYLRQLDHLASLVAMYERGSAGHALMVLER